MLHVELSGRNVQPELAIPLLRLKEDEPGVELSYLRIRTILFKLQPPLGGPIAWRNCAQVMSPRNTEDIVYDREY